MKTGRTIEVLDAQISEEGKAKRDYVAPTTALTMITVPRENSKPTIALQFNVGGQTRQYSPTNLCFGQIADRVGIPAKYAERMRTEAPELLAQNVNHWFQNTPEKRMLRTFNNGQQVARAFLSERYRPLDNYDLWKAIKPHLEAAACVVRSAEITETRFYIQASTERIQRPINQTITLAGGKQMIARIVEAGVIIGNSEVGHGSLFVESMIYDQWCTNGAVMQRSLKRHHVGRRNELFGEEDTTELFSNETRQKDDEATWLKVRDVVTAALSATRFNEHIDRLVATQAIQFSVKPVEVVETIAKKYDLAEQEKESILLHYMQGGDLSGFGLLQAITRTSQDVESYDRAVDLERLGPVVLLDDSEIVRSMRKN